MLGSVNLAMFVRNPFSDNAFFDFDHYRKIIGIFSRMLDNVVEMNGLPLPEQVAEIKRKRRHGMGFLGLGSAMTMMGMKYGSSESVAFTDEISKILAIEGWRAGVKLAKEKGCAPILEEDFEITAELLAKQPKLIEDGFEVGTKVKGRVLHALYSRYMQNIAEEDSQLVKDMAEFGCRYTHCTSIAPTGTMAAGEGNNASNGIEPSFTHGYTRNMIVPGKNTKEALQMLSYELMCYKMIKGLDTVDPDNPPEVFEGTTSEVDPFGHVNVQSAAQKWIDSAISKTINVPTDISYEKFKDIYLYAVDNGLKGCTTFRFNPTVHQGVLVKKSDLENTVYTFTLEDGTIVKAKGNDEIYYDNEKHTAANLFDAFNSGRYGKY